jgi:hypothetical protein
MLSTAPLIASISELLQRVMSARSDGERLTLGGRAARSNGGGEQTCDVHQSPAAPLTPRHRTKDSKAGLNCFEGTLRGSSPDRTTSGGSYGLPVPMSS